MSRTLVAIVLIVGMVTTVASQGDDRIDRLCQALGSEDAAERERATKELVAAGKPAVAPLRKLLDSPDAEVRARAELALEKIADRLLAEALQLVVTTDKKIYRPGEVVRVDARLRNASDDPVMALEFVWDGGLTADSWIKVSLEGKDVNYDGDHLGQVMVNDEVDESRFFTIPPKQEPVVRSVHFSQYWDLGGKDPSLIASYGQGKTLDLKPGTYKVRATYAFGPDNGEARDPMFGLSYRFKGKAKQLFDRCWTGALAAETEFTVTDKE